MFYLDFIKPDTITLSCSRKVILNFESYDDDSLLIVNQQPITLNKNIIMFYPVDIINKSVLTITANHLKLFSVQFSESD